MYKTVEPMLPLRYMQRAELFLNTCHRNRLVAASRGATLWSVKWVQK